jgi:hypothetical protein
MGNADCKDYYDKFVNRTLVNIFASIAVAVVNGLLKFAMKRLSNFRRPRTVTGQVETQTVNLFLAYFINMGILITLINSNFQQYAFFREFSLLFGKDLSQLILNGNY